MLDNLTGVNPVKMKRKINEIIQELRALNLVAGPGIRINRRLSGTIVESTQRSPGAAVDSGNNASYSGPFAVSWYSDNVVMISCKRPDYGSANGYCGSICAPDMMIVKHVQGAVVNYVPNSGNDLLVLIASWSSGSTVNTSFRFVPDPWTTCSDADRMIAADAANPVTQEFPLRDPRVSVYPVARIISGNKIIQLQNGHIVDYNRWWRA